MNRSSPQAESVWQGDRAGTPRSSFPGWLKWLEPPPSLPAATTNPAQIAASYRYWRREVLVWSLIGYSVFYFVRKNLGIAMPAMQESLGITKSELGLFLTLHGVI